MKKSEELSRKTGKLIAKNLIVLATLAVVAFAGVMSWFTKSQTATASGINVETRVADGLEFYIMPPSDSDQYDAINNRLSDNETWNTNNTSATPRRTTWHNSSDGSVLFDTSDQEFKFMEGLFLCDVTSDGYTFKIPKLMQYDEVAYVDTTQAFDTATANNEYMSFDLYFRSQTTIANHNIKLMSDSSISLPTEMASTYNTTHTYSQPGENYKGAAIGAVRTAIYNGNSREVLWIPGPYVYYDGLNDKLYTGVTSFTDKGTVYVYKNNNNEDVIGLRSTERTDSHYYYSAQNSRQTITYDATGMVAGETIDSDKTILTMSNHDTTNGYYYGHVRINLWIEGEDAESRLNFVGGKFRMSLHFEMD